MSSFKKLLAGTFALALGTAAHADSSTATIVRVTGSTAYRGATNTAITHIFDTSGGGGFIPLTYAYVGGTLSGAGQAIFHGMISGVEVIIETGFTGSVGGIQLVGQGQTTKFLDVTLADGNTLTAGGASGLSAGTSLYIPDVTMADTFQNATPFTASAPSPYTTQTLADTQVGIVPFKWVTSRGTTVINLAAATTTAGSPVVTGLSSTTGLAVGMTVSGPNFSGPTTLAKILSIDSPSQVTLSSSTGVLTGTGAVSFVSPSPITNITPQLAQAVFTSGFAELALFTGNSADIGTKVYAIGRDADSGTRLTAFAETGIGVNTPVKQYLPVASGGVVTAQDLTPALAINTVPYDIGNGGYISGGTLAGVMGNSTASVSTASGTAAPILYVTYLSTGDAGTAIAAGAKEITYNGVAFSNLAVQQGSYTFWSYEHLMYQTGIAAAKKTVADKLAGQILTTDATLLISTMKVGRPQDGGLVTQKYN